MSEDKNFQPYAKGLVPRIIGFVLVAVSVLSNLFAFKTGTENASKLNAIMLVTGAVIYFYGAWQSRRFK